MGGGDSMLLDHRDPSVLTWKVDYLCQLCMLQEQVNVNIKLLAGMN